MRGLAGSGCLSVTLTFFSTIYATLTFGYDPSPFILEIVSHAAMAGLDLKPWMTDIGALDAKGEPTDKLRHGSTFVTTMLVTKLFVPETSVTLGDVQMLRYVLSFDVFFRTDILHYRTSDIRHRTSDIVHPTSY